MKGSHKKRPCRICRRWFKPKPQTAHKQVTCGDSECQRERHRRQCANWNRKNAEYFKGNYLDKKLEKVAKKEALPNGPGDKASSEKEFRPLKSSSVLYETEVQLSREQVIVIQYLISSSILASERKVLKRFQDQLTVKLFERKEESEKVIRKAPD